MQKNGWQPTRSRTKSTEGQELTLAEIRALTGPALARTSENIGPDAVLNFKYLALISPKGSHPIVINWHDKLVRPVV